MGKLLRLLGFYLCIPIYKAILSLYEIFYYLASARFFTDDTIKTLNSNLYILISVVMLFAFSATMLAAIVNPDLIEDKKKGVGAVFKRGIIGVLLITIIPFAFDKAYELQKEVMDKHLIEKTLVGMRFKNDETNTGGNGGKVIAGSLISSVLYPDVGSQDGSVTIETEEGTNPQESYNGMVSDVRNMGDFSDYLNVYKKGTDDYAFEFNGIIAIIAGIAADYILLMFAIDMAVRLFKLAFFELTAPISIIAYIAAGGDTFKKWATQVGITFLDVFIRVGAMAFYLFLISNLNSFANSEAWSGAGFEGLGWLLLKLLLIIGMLIFVKQIPDLVKKAFGFEIKSGGGIKGRLSEMAGVGKQAAEAWDKIKKTAGLTALGAGVVAAAPLGTGIAAVGAGALHHGWKKGFGKTKAWKDTKFGRGITKPLFGPSLKDVGQAVKTGAGVAGAYLTGSNPIKGISAAKEKIGETNFGKERKTKKEEQAYINAGIDPKTGLMINPKTGEIKANATSVDAVNGIVNNSKGIKDSHELDTKKLEILDSLRLSRNRKTAVEDYKDSLDNVKTVFDKYKDDERVGSQSQEIANIFDTWKKNPFKNSANALKAIENLKIDEYMKNDLKGKVETSISKGITLESNKNTFRLDEIGYDLGNASLADAAKKVSAASNALNYDQSKYDSKFSDDEKNFAKTYLDIDDRLMSNYVEFSKNDNKPTSTSSLNTNSSNTVSSNTSQVNSTTNTNQSSGSGGQSGTTIINNNNINTTTQPDDEILKKYRNDGFNKNADGEYFNPWTNEYDKNYDPRKDPTYQQSSSDTSQNPSPSVDHVTITASTADVKAENATINGNFNFDDKKVSFDNNNSTSTSNNSSADVVSDFEKIIERQTEELNKNSAKEQKVEEQTLKEMKKMNSNNENKNGE